MSKKHLEQLYASQASRLLAFVRARMTAKQSASHQAEDILQETFASLLTALNFSTPLDNLTAYVYQSLKNRIIDVSRRQKQPVIDTLDFDETTFADDTRPLAEQAHLHWELSLALASLPDAQREVFLQTELEGLSYAEISQQNGIPVNTLIAQKRYAIQKLQNLLLEHE